MIDRGAAVNIALILVVGVRLRVRGARVEVHVHELPGLHSRGCGGRRLENAEVVLYGRFEDGEAGTSDGRCVVRIDMRGKQKSGGALLIIDKRRGAPQFPSDRKRNERFRGE